MPTLTFPLSRIEGHAQVVVEVHRGQVISAHFQAMEFRGFEFFVQGTPAEQMPVIVPRICGVCSTAHHVAAVKTLEQVYGVTPPPLAVILRELMLLGQVVQNQATSVFIFTMPDRLGLASIFDTDSNDQETSTEDASLATRALLVRRAGTDLITLAGGQFIHPVKAVIGGVTSGIDAASAALLRAQLEQTLPLACELFDYYWKLSLKLGDRLGTLGDDAPAHYIAAVDACEPKYYGDFLRVLSPEGQLIDTFPAANFREHLVYQPTDYSYAGQTSYQGDVMRANSLARINMAQCLGTPLADAYLDRFRDAFGSPAHPILLFDLARGIELVYALERAIEILSKPLDHEDTHVPFAPQDGEGYGLVEAPRGPLTHHYVVKDGVIAQAEFIIPTVHNSMAIEQALQVAAKRYISADGIDMELEAAVGRVVRAFDPCIACATH
jgi:coenzyme F420-reducing hydrogenase alpha subunit